jgi:UDP-N-acetylglucosamine diphosphorylase/glucosamine-1-phosphate N-acetyltransferase
MEDLEEYLGQPIPRDFFADLESQAIETRLIRRPWDLVKLNGREIGRDFNLLGGQVVESAPLSGVYLLGEDRMRIGRSVRLSPGVVLDATGGPVSIDSDVTIMSNASLQGPVHIGRGSVVKMGARIYGETTVGSRCKVGGEVAQSIFQGYTNKQHEGFVGHSYLGEWVNLGAGTDTSDLKNNYSTVRVGPPGQEEDSEEMFVGVFMGDHSKSGIGTVFNTGSLIGVCCNVFGAGFPPKFVPSFSWGGTGGFVEHDPDRALKTAVKMMARRDKALTPQAEALLRQVYELTADDRHAFLGP